MVNFTGCHLQRSRKTLKETFLHNACFFLLTFADTHYWPLILRKHCEYCERYFNCLIITWWRFQGHERSPLDQVKLNYLSQCVLHII